jgi:hypothetical protein
VEGVAGVLVVRDLVLAHEADGSHQRGEGGPEKIKSQNLKKTEKLKNLRRGPRNVTQISCQLFIFNIEQNMSLPFSTIFT